MGDTYEYLVHAVTIGRRKDKSRRSYVRFGYLYFGIEFRESCSSKLVISLSKVVILRIKVEDMKKICW